ncbi:sigma-70 family RNA polymerase sigma factor [Budvicia aquatica]|uniref:sigma-70 family RNA polymerase sigma factor n=1 Tax=Budvicia aquatica TaxID=82979 RepID=UPI00208CEE15|nr:sigma-70 family RNA polymerase sigma factor [Budvicia aquatica]GKX49844.1 DNA-directed RNA polymerase sigma-70 factor [Budvicia aquatica]
MKSNFDTLTNIEQFNRCMTTFWRQHEQELYLFFLGRLSDSEQAKDYLQDLFLKARIIADSFCSMDNPRAWLFKAARNMLIDNWRKNREFTELSEELPVLDSDTQPIEKLTTCLPQTLQKLSEQDQYIIQACDIEGFPQLMIAEQMGLTLPAFKSRLLRARLKLKEIMLSECQIEFADDTSICCHKHDDQ